MLLAAARQPNTVLVTIGVLLLLAVLVGVILIANYWTGRSKRERGIPKARRRSKGGKHSDHIDPP